MTERYSECREWKTYLRLMEQRPECFKQSEHLSIVTDSELVDAYVEKTGKRIGVLYQSEYHLLLTDLVRDEAGNMFVYERVLPAVRTGAVVALTTCRDRFVLLKQYRHAPREYQYAFPRGFGEQGLTSEENVRKELQEELGAEVIRSVYLGTVLPDSGFSGNHVDIFACEVEDVRTRYHYEGIEEVILLTRKELEEWIAGHKINDGFTLSAYSMYRLKKNL